MEAKLIWREMEISNLLRFIFIRWDYSGGFNGGFAFESLEKVNVVVYPVAEIWGETIGIEGGDIDDEESVEEGGPSEWVTYLHISIES